MPARRCLPWALERDGHCFCPRSAPRDPKVDEDYGREEECLAKGMGEMGGAYIVRLPCGPVNKYVRKELLWPHAREFADRGIAHANRTLAAMAEAGRRCELYAVHGHYADAGEVAVLMSSTLVREARASTCAPAGLTRVFCGRRRMWAW